MKLSTFLIPLVLCFSTLNAEAQQLPGARKEVADRFLDFYQKNLVDSIYEAFSADMKKALSPEKLGVLMNQLNTQFGGLTRIKYSSAKPAGVTEYIGRFEKAGAGLFLYVNQSNQIAGLFVRPYQDDSEDVKQRTDPDNISLKTKDASLVGTLVLPESMERAPVVLLIAGSGPTDRNSNSVLGVNANTFAMLAEDLKEAGIASVRYDKRGVGKSTTSVPEAEMRFDDMVKDAAGFVALLKNDDRFSKVIVCGHSEGSLVGMLAASQAGADAFISVAGPGSPADVLLKKQMGSEPASKAIDSVKNGLLVKGTQLPAGMSALFQPQLQPYLRSWMQYNPQTAISKLKMPVLIVQGTTDIQVGPDEARLLKGAAPSAQWKVIEGMNHVLKPAPAERQANLATYQDRELALHQELVPVISKFIRNLK